MNDNEFIFDLWDSVKDLIPAPKRDDAAVKFLTVLQDHGYEIDSSLEGEDHHLDNALEMIIEPEEEDDIDYFDYDE